MLHPEKKEDIHWSLHENAPKSAKITSIVYGEAMEKIKGANDFF